MASGPLRFRTPYIEELPTTQTRQAPGFAWVAVAGPSADPAKNWGTTNRKRARNAGLGQTDSQKEALSARQQREIERKIRELNSDNVRGDGVAIPAAKKDGSGSVGGGQVKAGKTPNTKKILASGKTFAHYLDDEEAEIARTGKRDIEGDGPSTATATATVATTQRASKTPLARRKPPQEVIASASPAPTSSSAAPALQRQDIPPLPAEDIDDDSVNDPLPTQAELEALINAPPLTYNQARSQPPPAGAPPPRKFCEICGYWGRVKCMKCGNMTCSVVCKDAHDENKCLKFYA